MSMQYGINLPTDGLAPPKSFADDGAVGAAGGAGSPSSSPTPGVTAGSNLTDGSAPVTAGRSTPQQLINAAAYAAHPTNPDTPVKGGPTFTPGDTIRNGEVFSSSGTDLGSSQQLAANTPSYGPGAPNTAGNIYMAGGGAIDDSSDGSGNDQFGTSLQQQINAAMSTVDNVLEYGRKLHGLSGGDGDDDDGGAINTAANMPTVPASQSESGVKPLQPMPGKLPPTSNPFGKRTADAGDQGDGTMQLAANYPAYSNARMPMVPGNQSDSGIKPLQPAPGPLPPTSNPFGKRTADAGDDQSAIDTEETA